MQDTLHLTYSMAELNFDERRYRQAAEALEAIVEEHPDNAAVRTLLARSYYHAAMLGKAEAQARAIVERWPADAYGHLLLARSLERQSRHDEAQPHQRLAAILGGEDDLTDDQIQPEQI